MNIKEFHRKISKDRTITPCIRIPLVMGSSWFIQGILYMDKTERYFKIITDILLSIIIYMLANYNTHDFSIITFNFLAAHTINWVINGQIPVALKNSGIINKTPSEINNYSIYIKNKLTKYPYFIFGSIYGSSSRDQLKTGSDLDVRVVRKKGLINGMITSVIIMKLRLSSLLSLFPLDIYLLDNFIKLKTMEESPIIFINKNE